MDLRLCICGLWLAGLTVHAAPPPERVTPGLVLERGGHAESVGPKLEPIGGGRLRHRDARFTAIIEPDGSVEFRDVFGQTTVDILGFDLARRRFKEYKPLAGDYIAEQALYPKGPPTASIMAGVGFRFGGLADGRRARAGHDGTRNTSAKLAFLHATEALRLRMAYSWARDRMRDAQDELIDDLLDMWRDGSRSLAERRHKLFLAWDACDDPRGTTAPLERLRAEAGAAARDRIEALVRLLAPPGSPAQYTAAELAALNARRRSVRPFDPYRVQPSTPSPPTTQIMGPERP